MIEAQVEVLIKYGIRDEYNSSAIALVHSALMFATTSEDDSDNVPLHVRIKELRQMEQELGSNSTKSTIPLELATIAADFLAFRYTAIREKAKLARVVKWLEENPLTPENESLYGEGNIIQIFL